MRISEEQILSDLKAIGIKNGDVVFITADLLKPGFFIKGKSAILKKWVDMLIDAVGETGTIIAASYSKNYLRFFGDKNNPYVKNSIPTSGSLSNALVSDERSFRSEHPTNSYVGIGPLAKEILSNHGADGMSYDPIGKIIDLGGKNLMLGTVDEKNAPMVFHYSQQMLGYTKKDPLCGFGETYYRQDSKLIKFIRRDVGGCSAGAHKLYGKLIDGKCISIGMIGNAPSALIDAKSSYKIIYEIVKNNKSMAFCNDFSCLSCYGRFSNVGHVVVYCYALNCIKLLRYIKRKIFKK